MAKARRSGDKVILTMTDVEAAHLVDVIDGALDAGLAWGGFGDEAAEALSSIETSVRLKIKRAAAQGRRDD